MIDQTNGVYTSIASGLHGIQNAWIACRTKQLIIPQMRFTMNARIELSDTEVAISGSWNTLALLGFGSQREAQYHTDTARTSHRLLY